jgi:methionyl-tRNA formyltransferase
MRIVFIGTGAIGVPTLNALQRSEHELVAVVTQPDKPAGRDQELAASPIKKALGRNQMVPIFQPRRIKDPESIAHIRQCNPDVLVVVAYGQILPRDLLEIPALACLNLHASLLPRWRGAAPIQAAIAGGDQETGVTVMYMDEGLDTGDILLQRKTGISPEETARSLHDRLATIAPPALLESLRLLRDGKAPRQKQDNALATYAPKLKREDGRIDWSQPAEVIERKIRAYNPWPGAFTEIAGRALKVFSAAVVDCSGTPGEILDRDMELIIAAGRHALSLGEVQLEGKRRMSASEFLRGYRSLADAAS